MLIRQLLDMSSSRVVIIGVWIYKKESELKVETWELSSHIKSQN